jgi:hypothetical protein
MKGLSSLLNVGHGILTDKFEVEMGFIHMILKHGR